MADVALPYDVPLFRDFYSIATTGPEVVAGNLTWGRGIYFLRPCTVEGIYYYHIIPDGDIRIGLWGALPAPYEFTDQRKDYLAQELNTNLRLSFAESLTVTWDLIATQRDNSPFIMSVTDLNGQKQQRKTSALEVVLNQASQCGRCTFNDDDDGRKSDAASGWAYPSNVTEHDCMDLICLPTADDDGFEPLLYVEGYGRSPAATVVSVDRSIGQVFCILQSGCSIYGIRFYTADPAPWTAKCSCYAPADGGGGQLLDVGTVECSGAGFYNYLFPDAVVITKAHMRYQSYTSSQDRLFVVQIYNQTNNNYTLIPDHADNLLIPYSSGNTQFVQTDSFLMQEPPFNYQAGDNKLSSEDNDEWYPVGPLIKPRAQDNPG